ncbi:hypothetical protein LCGC14_1318230 [marine sediment metagenome]|uniref:Uncharacterized protein n=1 Tax=marine sediment metagenome TaxID=412755 RepID=A0A0F9L5N3_9ZZZZ
MVFVFKNPAILMPLVYTNKKIIEKFFSIIQQRVNFSVPLNAISFLLGRHYSPL